MFRDKVILIVGGSGILGTKLAQVLLQRYPEIQRIHMYSRSRTKQEEAARLLQHNPKLKFYLGDVLHQKKLVRSMQGVDYVVNAVEYEGEQDHRSAYSYFRWYLDGTQNLIDAAFQQNIARVIHLSSPEACNPQSLKGLAQLAAEKLIISANEIGRQPGKETALAVLRYGKAINGRDGMIKKFLQLRDTGCLAIEDANSTRYWFTLEHGVSWILKGLNLLKGGEIMVPQCPSVRLLDLAKALCPLCQLKVREEKGDYQQHEVMITTAEGASTLECKGYYLVQPNFPWWEQEECKLSSGGRETAADFSYSSALNNSSLTPEELQLMLRCK